jgi:putative peptidoglycan lipid II flippase
MQFRDFKRILLAQALVPALVGLGLIAGFGKEIAIAKWFGTAPDVELFRLATGLPSVFSDTISLPLSAYFVGWMARSGFEEQTKRSQVSWAMLLMTGAIVIVGLMTTHLQVAVFASGLGDDAKARLVSLCHLAWIAIVPFLIAVPNLTFSTAQGQRITAAANPLVRNTGFVLFFMLSLTAYEPNAYILVLVGMLSYLAVFVFQFLSVRSVQPRHFNFNVSMLLNNFRIILSVVVSAATLILSYFISSLGRLADRAYATHYPQGTLAALEYSYSLMLAIAIFIGTSASILIATQVGLSVKTPSGALKTVWKNIGLVAALSLLCAIILSPLSHMLVEAVYQRGRFSGTDTELTAFFLAGQIWSLAPIVTSALLSQLMGMSGLLKSMVALNLLKFAIRIVLLHSFGTLVPDMQIFAIALFVSEVVFSLSAVVLLAAAKK